MASSDALPIPRKNVAYRVIFPIFKNDGTLITGASGLDSEVSKDQGTFADCTNEATEIATSSGMYYLDLTATEMNADCVALIVKSSTTGALTQPIVLYPEEAGDIRVNITAVLGSAIASINEFKADVSALASQASVNLIKAVTDLFHFTGASGSEKVNSYDSDVLAALAGLSAGDVTVISPVDAADSTITIYRGDDYKAAESRRLSWTSSAWTAYNITGATILFSARYKRATGALFTKAGTVLDATTIAVELTNAETLALGLEGTTFAFDVQATLTNSDVVTLAWGDMFITPDVR